MTAQTNHKSGIDAEAKCREYLEGKKFTVLASRYKTRHGEIDIIARTKDLLVFVEVKKRKKLYDDPVTPVQKSRIIDAATQYIAEHPEISLLDMRFDCILINPEQEINHIEDAWRLEHP